GIVAQRDEWPPIQECKDQRVQPHSQHYIASADSRRKRFRRSIRVNGCPMPPLHECRHFLNRAAIVFPLPWQNLKWKKQDRAAAFFEECIERRSHVSLPSVRAYVDCPVPKRNSQQRPWSSVTRRLSWHK